jgi:hypothetical protein
VGETRIVRVQGREFWMHQAVGDTRGIGGLHGGEKRYRHGWLPLNKVVGGVRFAWSGQYHQTRAKED